jgi:glyoxylase-like metal-dependent hydrolase (beta-lactamase superfamily II)
MAPQIIPFQSSINTCYIIKDKGAILVDAGSFNNVGGTKELKALTGADGHIIYTPGHTDGSVSVLLDSGEAFVGCLIHNRAPFVFKPGLPIYAKDILQLKLSLKMVIDRGAKILYPGHGNPVPVQKILKYIN